MKIVINGETVEVSSVSMEQVNDAIAATGETKQDKLTGTAGQVVGFNAQGQAVAQTAPDTGVTSFKGRKGAVTPQTGDYTAEQVGARPSTWMPTAANVGAVPTGRKVNGKPLSADISLTASDVGAMTQAQGDARYLKLAGGDMTGMVDMQNNVLTGIPTPVSPADAVNYQIFANIIVDMVNAPIIIIVSGKDDRGGSVSDEQFEFVVGDVISSIYNFTGTDLELYISCYCPLEKISQVTRVIVKLPKPFKYPKVGNWSGILDVLSAVFDNGDRAIMDPQHNVPITYNIRKNNDYQSWYASNIYVRGNVLVSII